VYDLTLLGNRITDKGARAIANYLKKSGLLVLKLQSKVYFTLCFNFPGNYISTIGARKIAKALRDNTTLKYLDMAGV
jgi:hypothetical protein